MKVFPSEGWSAESGRGGWSGWQGEECKDKEFSNLCHNLEPIRREMAGRRVLGTGACHHASVVDQHLNTNGTIRTSLLVVTCRGSGLAMTDLANSWTEARLVRSRSIISTLELPVEATISFTAFRPLSLLRQPKMRKAPRWANSRAV